MAKKKKKSTYKVVCYLKGKKVGHAKYSDSLSLAVREAIFQPRNIICVVFKNTGGRFYRIARYQGGKRVSIGSMLFKKLKRRKKRSDAGRRRIGKKKSDFYKSFGREKNAGQKSFHYPSKRNEMIKKRRNFRGISIRKRFKKKFGVSLRQIASKNKAETKRWNEFVRSVHSDEKRVTPIRELKRHKRKMFSGISLKRKNRRTSYLKGG